MQASVGSRSGHAVASACVDENQRGFVRRPTRQSEDGPAGSPLAREGVPHNVTQRQLGHANLGTTSIYLQGIDVEEIIATVHARRAPMISATAGLQL
jgi:hypothetical protein